MWQDVKPTENERFPWSAATNWPNTPNRIYRFVWYIGDYWKHESVVPVYAFQPKARGFSPAITRICWAEADSAFSPPK